MNEKRIPWTTNIKGRKCNIFNGPEKRKDKEHHNIKRKSKKDKDKEDEEFSG